MNKYKFCLTVIVSFVCVGAARLRAAEGDIAFSAQVADVLENNCLHCHEGTSPESGIDLTPLLDKDEFHKRQHASLWTKLERAVADGIMPPKDETQPTTEEKKVVIEWYRQNIIL
jgi:uncharacterized membrane protein